MPSQKRHYQNSLTNAASGRVSVCTVTSQDASLLKAKQETQQKHQQWQHAQSQLEAMQEEKAKLKQQNNALQNQITALNAARRKHTQQTAQQLKSSKQQLDSAEKSQSHAEKAVNDLANKIAKIDHQIHKITNEIKKLEEPLKKLTQDLKSNQDAQNTIHQKIDPLVAKIHTSFHKLESIKSDYDAATKKINSYKTQVSMITDNISLLQQESESAARLVNYNSSEAKKLIEQAEKMQKGSDQVSQLEERLRYLTAEETNFKKLLEMEKNPEDKQKVQERLEYIVKAKKGAQVTLQSLRLEHSKTSQELVNKAQTHLNMAKVADKRLKEIPTEIQESKIESQKINQSLQNVSIQAGKYKSSFISLNKEISQAKIEIETHRSQLTELQKLEQGIHHEIDANRNRQTQLNHESKQLQQHKTGLESQHKSVKTTYLQKREYKEQLSSKHAQLKDTIVQNRKALYHGSTQLKKQLSESTKAYNKTLTVESSLKSHAVKCQDGYKNALAQELNIRKAREQVITLPAPHGKPSIEQYQTAHLSILKSLDQEHHFNQNSSKQLHLKGPKAEIESFLCAAKVQGISSKQIAVTEIVGNSAKVWSSKEIEQVHSGDAMLSNNKTASEVRDNMKASPKPEQEMQSRANFGARVTR